MQQHLVSEERHKDNDPLNCLFHGFWTGFCNRSEWDFLALIMAVSSSTEAAMEEAVFSPFRSGMWYCLFCLSGSGLGGGLASWGWMCHIVTHLVPRAQVVSFRCGCHAHRTLKWHQCRETK